MKLHAFLAPFNFLTSCLKFKLRATRSFAYFFTMPKLPDLPPLISCTAGIEYWSRTEIGLNWSREEIKQRLGPGGRDIYHSNVPESVRNNKAKLLKYNDALNRGHLIYDAYPMADLLNFASNRKLDLGTSSTKRRVVKVLERADDNATFHQFLELPAELRMRVYQLYYADISVPLTSPVEPPVTRASRQFRSEALPIFYATCTFAVHVVATSGMKPSFTEGVLAPTSLNYFYGIPEADLQVITNLLLCRIDKYVNCTISVVLEFASARFQVHVHTARISRGQAAWWLASQTLNGDDLDMAAINVLFKSHLEGRMSKAASTIVKRKGLDVEGVELLQAALDFNIR